MVRRGWVLVAVAVLSSGCISGRVLEGYPGYPFLRLEIPAEPESTFVDLQRALRAEGFEIDFSSRERGLVHTRPATRAGREFTLDVIVDLTAETGEATATVWIAGYEPRAGGARRINPLDEEEWAELEDIAVALSRRLGGGVPVGPQTE